MIEGENKVPEINPQLQQCLTLGGHLYRGWFSYSLNFYYCDNNIICIRIIEYIIEN